MKKVLYAILCCTALLSVGTAVGREALANRAAGVMQRAPEDGDTYVYINSVIDLQIKYDAASNRVKIDFTAPRQAEWRPETWDDYEFETIDKICIYRNEGQYYDESARELVKEFVDVAKGIDISWEDETALEHGKTFYYNVIACMGDREGGRDGGSVLVGQTIDPASSFKLLPGENGARMVTVQLVAPTTANGGECQLDRNIPKIEITRQNANDSYGEGDVIRTFENVAPGAAIEHVDTDAALESGKSYRYRLNIYYDGSKTRPWQNNEVVFVGADEPAAVAEVVAEVLPDGESVKVSWTPFEGNGVKGGWVDPATLCYNVYRSNTSDYNDCPLIAEGIKDTELIDNGIKSEGSYMYIVYTCKGSEESASTNSNRVTAGPLTTMPFVESWSNYKPQYSTWEKTRAWANCSSMSSYITSPQYIEYRFTPADDDNGMMACQPTKYNSPQGTVETLTTGRISVAGAVNPILSFEYLDIDPILSDNTFKVYIAHDGGEFTQLKEVDIDALPGVNEWINFTINLADYIGSANYIQVKFEVVVGSMIGKSAIDRVQIRELMPVDLVANAKAAVTKFYPGTRFKVSVDVANTGDYAGEPFAAKVYLADKEIGQADGQALAAFQSTKLIVPVAIPDDVPAGEQDLRVEILTDGDEADKDNNICLIPVEVVELPYVTCLDHNDGRLSWEAVGELPYNDGVQLVAEDFAGYDHLATGSIGGWTTIDADGSDTYWFNATKFPLDGKPVGGVVVNPETIGAYFSPAAGQQCLLFVSATGASDDWLISPALSGTAQTISFKVQTTDMDAEKFEVMYSTTDATPSSFVTARKFENFKSQDKWTDIEVALPEGAKYFAIHYYSFYCSGLAVDDIRYMSANDLDSPATMHIGYNVWCDGQKLNSDTVADTFYDLADGAPQGEYTVTAVYNNAESRHSASLLLSTDGAGEVAAAASIAVSGNIITISGEGAYAVADLAGRIIARGLGTTEITLPAGTYVVMSGNQIVKVVL